MNDQCCDSRPHPRGIPSATFDIDLLKRFLGDPVDSQRQEASTGSIERLRELMDRPLASANFRALMKAWWPELVGKTPEIRTLPRSRLVIGTQVFPPLKKRWRTRSSRNGFIRRTNPQQFDALAAVRRFKIQSALPSLERLRAKLNDAPGPEAPFLRAKVDRLLTFLRTGNDSNRGPRE